MTNQERTGAPALETADITVQIHRYEMFMRLKENKDFQDLILKGYLEDEPKRLTALLATHYCRSSGTRPFVMEELIAISGFGEWLRIIEMLGRPYDETEDELDGSEEEL